MDFVLHLLSSIVNLPVTKGIIKDSGLGKAVGSVEKHSIFKGTPNQSPISIRVQKIKDSWHACVKAQKLVDASSKQTTSVNTTGLKRPADVVPIESSSAVKKVKTTAIVDDAKKGSTLSTLLKKVTVVPTGVIKSATKGLQMTLKTRTGSNDDDENNKLDSKGKLNYQICANNCCYIILTSNYFVLLY